MAEIATVARPYAEALFRVVIGEKDKNSLSAWADLINEMSQVAKHPDVKELVQNPKISSDTVTDVFISALKSLVGQENQAAKNFIRALAENKRLLLLPEVAQQFMVLKNAHEGAADAFITSAFPLTEEQTAKLCASLEARFSRKLKPLVDVDETLIGGVRVMVGDEVLDTSVRAKLEQMQIALTA